MSDIERPEPDSHDEEPTVSEDGTEEPVDPISRVTSHLPLEANEADVLEQAEELPVDDDDFR